MSRKQYKKFEEYGQTSQRKFRKLMDRSELSIYDSDIEEPENVSTDTSSTCCSLFLSEKDFENDLQTFSVQV